MSDRRKKRKSAAKTRSHGDHTVCSQKNGDEPPGPSSISVKSNRSKGPPIDFRKDRSKCQKFSEELSSCSVCQQVLKDLVYFICGHPSCKDCLGLSLNDLPTDSPCTQCGETFMENTLKDRGNSVFLEAKMNLKKGMKNKFTLTSEGNGDYRSSLKSIYTTLFITTGDNDGRNQEHEFRQLRNAHPDQPLSDSTVNLSELFQSVPDQDKPSRTVLTKGVAGIGKSFAVQKFILDWAEEETNQQIDFVFSLPFRELNLIVGEKSLHELLTEFHPSLRPLKDSQDYSKTKIIVILDGLDENRHQLDFQESAKVTSLDDVASVGDLVVNLIQGNLLPDANVWITSRPAAASQIPAEHIDMVTEIRGFSDGQKVEYFRKRFGDDSSLTDRIISHIHSSQSLDIMCQIPIFCWISAVLFQEVFSRNEETEIPQTLTELMAHFVFAQTKRRSRKYDRNPEKNREKLLKTHREFLLKLGKLAFVQLQENQLIFYEKDLEDCGIDVGEATIYSGLCNTVLQEEEVSSQKKIFFFVHLTLQEFFAALHVYECLKTKKTNELGKFLSVEDEDVPLLDLLKMTIDKVLEKKNGYLDFFLRFLLGLMVEPNQRFLQGLLTPLDEWDDTDKKILTYLRSIRRKNISPDSCITIFQTMTEMRDHKVKDEIQEFLKLSDHSKMELAPLHCSALAYMLQASKNDLDLLDLKSYNTSYDGRRRLIPAVRSSKRAVLANCKVTMGWMEPLAIALKFSYSALSDLDLSNNDLKDSGVEVLCGGLSSNSCKLEILRMSGCWVTETGCDHLVSALQSNPSHLMELDLSYNHPGDSGGKKLSKLSDDPQYKLTKLNLDYGGTHRLKPGFRKYACELTFSPDAEQQQLVLSEGNRKVTRVEDETSGHHQQVLCSQGLIGRHYWEVEVSGSLSIGVAHEAALRKDKTGDFRMGRNKDSWCLVCSDGFHVLHHNDSVDVSSLGRRTSRLGVYLDWPAGTLSFYRVSSDSLIHLHTYTVTFSEPLYPAVELNAQSSARFCIL
ncbi:protein NLRC3-like [Poecilia latipinna]|uniref:protein NLRC3-like n=1 Tax=Poecilia latipinna TaxID=48699 RepID=UPI00072E2C3E|nr:PREDICTED: protein NLRC3-like [Poecilia latipinna]XP_014896389.1 PREDICTED: protein NLRC3-like [Poecilia latipinna]